MIYLLKIVKRRNQGFNFRMATELYCNIVITTRVLMLNK
jgi:ribosomal protein L34